MVTFNWYEGPSTPKSRLRRLRGLPDVGRPPPPIKLTPSTIRVNGDVYTIDPNLDWPYRGVSHPNIAEGAEHRMQLRWPTLPAAPFDWWERKTWDGFEFDWWERKTWDGFEFGGQNAR